MRGGDCVSNGGRVLGVTARGVTVQDAISRAYEGVKEITWQGVQYRKDIGHKAIERVQGTGKTVNPES